MAKLAINGGSPVRTKDFTIRTTMGEREKKAVAAVMDKGDISLFFGSPGKFFLGGEQVQNFEKKWAGKYNFKHAVTVNSWTTGLMTAVGACGVGPGDEVICPPYSMSATTTSILFYGGIPVFVDIEPETFNIDPTKIEKAITPRTKAIMLVHLFGHPANMDAIMAIAKKHKLKVIEDAAHAPGVKYGDKYVGCIGDVGGFSLNYHKHIHTGEGGVIVTNDDFIAQRCQMIRNHGENVIEAYGITDLTNAIGSNYRLTEIQAAIGLCQLDDVETCIDHRNKLHNVIKTGLHGMDGITVPVIKPNCTHAFYVYAFKFDENIVGVSRDKFVNAVMAELPQAKESEQIPLVQSYIRPLYLNQIYQQKIALGAKGFPFNYNQGVEYDYSKGLCPVVERMWEKELFYSPIVREAVTPDDIQDLVRAMQKVYENRHELNS